MLVARFINWHETLDECGYSEPWATRGQQFIASMRAGKARREKALTGAYIISNNGEKADKITIVEGVFNRALTSGESLRRARLVGLGRTG